MTVDFIRFKASDQVELQGWLSNVVGETAAIHLHGMSGNGYENYFLDSLRTMYTKNWISFFPIDTRGRGVISDFRQGSDWKTGGSCFEIFDESVFDIQGAMDFLKTLGKTKFVLQGHSLGASKTVNYVLQRGHSEINALVLLAPTDMVGWASSHPEHKEYLATAEKLLSEGKGKELVAPQCWLDKTPISAQTYPTICRPGTAVDIYNSSVEKAPLGRVTLPTIIVYGDEDIGITKVDGSMGNWLKRVNKIKNKNTVISVISGAGHGLRGYEEKLSQAVESFIVKHKDQLLEI